MNIPIWIKPVAFDRQAMASASETPLKATESSLMQARTSNTILKQRESNLLQTGESIHLHPKISNIIQARESNSHSELCLKAKSKRVEQLEAHLKEQKEVPTYSYLIFWRIINRSLQ